MSAEPRVWQGRASRVQACAPGTYVNNVVPISIAYLASQLISLTIYNAPKYSAVVATVA
jgi:hypothetical protein